MRLSLRATQRVVMTPLLQQAIQLLQLSTLELEQVVRKELEENPLLEELPEEKQEVDGEAPTTTAADGTELAPAPTPPEPQQMMMDRVRTTSSMVSSPLMTTPRPGRAGR